jgi:hypothetical protein
MFSRIVVVAVLILAFMIAVKDGALGRVGLTGSCKVVQTAADGSQWTACSSGKLAGRPDLSKRSCTEWGRRGPLAYWHCPAPVQSTAAGR